MAALEKSALKWEQVALRPFDAILDFLKEKISSDVDEISWLIWQNDFTKSIESLSTEHLLDLHTSIAESNVTNWDGSFNKDSLHRIVSQCFEISKVLVLRPLSEKQFSQILYLLNEDNLRELLLLLWKTKVEVVSNGWSISTAEKMKIINKELSTK